MISSASDADPRGAHPWTRRHANPGGAGSNSWRNADARRSDARRSDARLSDARRDPDPRCSGAPSGGNADSFSADADTGINGKGNRGEHQRRPDDNDGCKSHHDFSSFPFLFLSIRAAPSPKDTRPEQARSRD